MAFTSILSTVLMPLCANGYQQLILFPNILCKTQGSSLVTPVSQAFSCGNVVFGTSPFVASVPYLEL